MRKWLTFFIGVFFWATYFLPIYSFEKAFRISSLDVLDFISVDFRGIIVYSGLAIILTLIGIQLSPKIGNQIVYKISSVVVYIAFYCFACIAIAWDYRIAFGTTWRWYELFPEVIMHQWYFYVLGIFGLYFNYQYQNLIQQNKLNQS